MRILVALTIMICFILLIVLVLNMEEKSKIIKSSFIIFTIAFLIFVFVVNELVLDYLISLIIRFYYFPTFSSIIAILIFAICMFVYSVNNTKYSDKYRIINYIFALLIIIGYIIFLLLDIDINSYSYLYSGTSLKCLRYISRTFILWMLVLAIIKYYKHFIKER